MGVYHIHGNPYYHYSVDEFHQPALSGLKAVVCSVDLPHVQRLAHLRFGTYTPSVRYKLDQAAMISGSKVSLPSLSRGAVTMIFSFT